MWISSISSLSGTGTAYVTLWCGTYFWRVSIMEIMPSTLFSAGSVGMLVPAMATSGDECTDESCSCVCWLSTSERLMGDHSGDGINALQNILDVPTNNCQLQAPLSIPMHLSQLRSVVNKGMGWSPSIVLLTIPFFLCNLCKTLYWNSR